MPYQARWIMTQRQMFKSPVLWLTGIACALLLTACGGGGDDVQSMNTNPMIEAQYMVS